MPFYETSRRPVSGEVKRLQFLVDLVSLSGLKFDKVANLIGLKRATLYTAIKEDDMNLSRAEEIVSALGYKLTVFLFKDESEEKVRHLSQSDVFVTPAGEYRLKRLAFLSAALSEYKIAKVQLAQSTGLAISTVATWWRVDDIKISRIFQIADAFGLSLKFSMEPSVSQDRVKGRRQVIDIKQSKSISLENGKSFPEKFL